MDKQDMWLFRFAEKVSEAVENACAFSFEEQRGIIMEHEATPTKLMFHVSFGESLCQRQHWMEEICDIVRDKISLDYPLSYRTIMCHVQSDYACNQPRYNTQRTHLVYWIEVVIQKDWLKMEVKKIYA